MKKFVNESLSDFLNEYRSPNLIRNEIRTLMEDLGYTTNNSWDVTRDPYMKTEGYYEFFKSINGGELTIIITPKFSSGKPSEIIEMSAHWSSRKKLFKRTQHKDINDTYSLDLGEGLFKTSDADMLSKISDYVDNIEKQI